MLFFIWQKNSYIPWLLPYLFGVVPQLYERLSPGLQSSVRSSNKTPLTISGCADFLQSTDISRKLQQQSSERHRTPQLPPPTASEPSGLCSLAKEPNELQVEAVSDGTILEANELLSLKYK